MTTIEQYGFDQPQVWSTELAHQKIEASGDTDTKRTSERQLQALDFLPAALTAENSARRAFKNLRPLCA
jgi:hypothetical protein